MMHFRLTRFLFAFSAVLMGCDSATFGQQAKPSPTPTPTPGEIVTVRINRVRLPITVVDKKGFLVGGLTKADFQVLEDKIPQTIETFSDDVGRELPLYVGVLMDTSPSTA